MALRILAVALAVTVVVADEQNCPACECESKRIVSSRPRPSLCINELLLLRVGVRSFGSRCVVLIIGKLRIR
jgi:hypothetical protein